MNIMADEAQLQEGLCEWMLKWSSHQKATKALFVIEYESNLCVKA